MDKQYTEYSLSQLDNWIHDAISCSEASPQEIYDVIKKAVEEEYYYYKHLTGQTYELLALLNGNGKEHLSCDKDDPSPECESAWNDFWEEPKDKVVKWVLPIEIDGPSAEYYITLPDDLQDAANIHEGDTIEWIDLNNGSFEMRKVTN